MNRTRQWVYPVTTWLVVLGVVFATEYAVMFLLPLLLPRRPSRLLESTVDAVLLTALLAPFLWWTLVRPLREVIRLRTQFLAELFAQMESDRRQVAHELHDGVGQSLTLLVSGLRSTTECTHLPGCASRIRSFQRLAEDALLDVKRVALGLRPSLLDDLGLAPALERLAADVRVHHPVELSLDVTGVAGVQLPEPVATAVFRIVQEALANLVKHSQARHAAISVRHAGGEVVVEVTDDGVGFDPKSRSSSAGHLGLTGMRERATLLGGEFSLDTAPGRGTRVAARIPVGGAAGG